ncbi:MAG TPA: HAD-IA family hydrolase [Candidatus Polarisedimenticolia bacterium]|nr:HAD-IA family hydrolase [Candidatus Polarisedimenticolia bacterium]
MSGAGRECIRLISFDVGGTLIHPDPPVGAVYAEVLTRRGLPCREAEVERAFEESWEAASGGVAEAEERYSRAPHGERGYWRDLLSDTVRRLGGSLVPPGAADELFERFAHAECWKVYPEVFDTLAALKRRGLEMAVVSNWDSRLPALLRELGLRRHFGPLIVSAIEGAEKPDARLFRLAADRAGVRPAEVLHVGDRLREDVQGAFGAGFAGLAIDRSAAGGEALDKVLDWLDAPFPAIREVPP